MNKTILKYGLLALIMLMVNCQWSMINGQSRRQERKAKIDSVLTARYYRSPYDTNYVVRPEGKLTLKIRLNQSGNDFYVRGTMDGMKTKANLHTSHKTTVSIAASYRGLSVALALNPAKLSGAYKDYELNLNYFSSRFSIDASYQRSETLSGDIKYGDETGRMEEGDVRLNMLNITGYYVFNHRHFSYPAAFTQSYIQRRSAGSWLAGISYLGGTIKTTEKLQERNPDAAVTRIYAGHLGIGGGYGYNWVVAKKWLFHISAMPTIVVYNRNNYTLNGERIKAKHIRFNMLFNERAAIVYNFSPRYFVSATLVMNNSFFDDESVTVNQSKWRARAAFGFRL